MEPWGLICSVTVIEPLRTKLMFLADILQPANQASMLKSPAHQHAWVLRKSLLVSVHGHWKNIHSDGKLATRPRPTVSQLSAGPQEVP